MKRTAEIVETVPCRCEHDEWSHVSIEGDRVCHHGCTVLLCRCTGYRPPSEPSKVAPVSPSRSRLNRERREIRERVFARDGFRCQANWPDVECYGPLTVHHLKKASQGGAYTEANLVSLCSHHNSLVEDFPVTAELLGLVIRSKAVSS